ncbi:unnamed protein product [Moneuplotes crassus]|uniref:Uncharacterized protein n=1 Tax=Euplotes crassus TaxID=5936 RepID=A0AAD1Y1B3_EUPCR|nr:unnamed protein product [Moneuplotes crassus]
MLQDQSKRYKCFQLFRIANVVVLVIIFTVCGFINYGSKEYFDIFMYHLAFAIPTIMFHLVPYFRINTIFVCLTSLFYLGVIFWALITYVKMSTTEKDSEKEMLSFFLYHYLVPGSMIGTSFLVVASFYMENEEDNNDIFAGSNIEIPIARPHYDNVEN